MVNGMDRARRIVAAMGDTGITTPVTSTELDAIRRVVRQQAPRDEIRTQLVRLWHETQMVIAGLRTRMRPLVERIHYREQTAGTGGSDGLSEIMDNTDRKSLCMAMREMQEAKALAEQCEKHLARYA